MSTRNLALRGDTAGSSPERVTGRTPDKAVDGNRNTDPAGCFEAGYFNNPFLRITIDEVKWIQRIVITNRDNNGL